MWGALFVVIILLTVLLVGWWWSARRRGRGHARSSRVTRAAALRSELIAITNDADVADRLAEGERKRDPSADMLTCYQNALLRIRRERAR